MPRNGVVGLVDRETSRRLSRFAFHCVLWSLVTLVLVPLIWPLMVSLNEVSVTTLLDRGFGWWLGGVEIGLVAYTLLETPFLGLLANSVLVATVTALVGTALAATSAYALDRFEFPGRGLVSGSLLGLLMVPKTIVAIPLFLLLRSVGLFNTHLGLVVAYVAFTLPFTIWLLRPFFTELPERCEEAARVDGCTRFGAFIRVFLPVAKPALAGAFTFSWILAYNEFLFASILINDPAKRTLPIGYSYGVGDLGVASLLASLPILAIFAVLWRYFLRSDVDRFVN